MIKNVIVKIDIENCWVEIRANNERSKKVVKISEQTLGLKNLKLVKILNNYDDINDFKSSLIDGFYLNYKDGKKLLSKLEKLDYDTEGLSLGAILLVGVDSMGMKIRNVIDGPLYTMQVGLRSNSIVFRMSVTEDVLEYTRNKIL